MRYGIHLLPDAFLLVALLRMAFLGLAAQRPAMFFFLCVWLAYCFTTLFLGQVWPADSHSYALAFFILTAFAWAAGLPALWGASLSATRTFTQAATILLVFVIACSASHFALETSAASPIAQLLAVNCWIAVVVGVIFWFASVKTEGPDLYLWRCCCVFFLLYGFGYLAIGILRPSAWAYICLALAATAVWIALAWFIDPNHEHLFNLEKLALVPTSSFRKAFARERNV